MNRSGFPSSSYHYNYRKPSSPLRAMDESTEGCSRVLQLVLVTFNVFAVVFSLSVLGNCEFLWFYKPNLEIEEELNTTNLQFELSRVLDPEGETKLSFGLFKFQDPMVSSQCYDYEQQTHLEMVPDDLPLQMEIARWSMSISAAMSIVAFCMLLLEICCCRFMCSRVMINMSFLIAFCGIPPTFLLYTQGVCNIFSSSNYACNLGQGAIQALISLALLFVTLVLSCVTPKATPILRVIQDREKRAEHDPCCCWGGRSKQEVYEENPELLLANLPSDHVHVPSAGGDGTTFAFKHYFDDQAGGMTLQSQYNAASKRWLQCERDYADALDRFKQECKEAAKYDNSLDSDWRFIIGLPLKQISDPELARQREVLATLGRGCDQARRAMDRIEADLEEHIRPTDEKIEAALKDLQEQQQLQQQEENHQVASDTADSAESKEKQDSQKQETANAEAVTEDFDTDPQPTKAVLTPEIGKECEESPTVIGNDTFVESFSVEDNQFKSAMMAIEESNIDEEGSKGETSSWAAWMGFDKSEDSKYKKLT